MKVIFLNIYIFLDMVYYISIKNNIHPYYRLRRTGIINSNDDDEKQQTRRMWLG